MTIVAAGHGLTVVSPTGRPITTIAWADVASLDADGAIAPNGGAAGPRALILSVGESRHTFMAPARDIEAFLAGAVAVREPGRRNRPTAVSDRVRSAVAYAQGAAVAAAALGHAVLGRMQPSHRGGGHRAPAHAVARCASGAGSTRPSAGTRLHAGRPRQRRELFGATRLLHRPRHATAAQLRITPVMACLGALALVIGGATIGSLGTSGATAATEPSPGAGQGQDVSIMNRMDQQFAGSHQTAALPAASAPPAPAPPSLAGAPALSAHEIFGFAPYWTLPVASGFDVAAMTTLAYFSVDVNGDGSIAQSGPGWNGYQSQDLADLVTRAHDAGARVVLTATCFGQSALDQLAADPTAGGRLGAELVQLVQAKNLDGVNIDFEGQGAQDQSGLDTLMAAVSMAAHQADAHWQVTMDTYASSAGDPGGFYDIHGLAPSVDAFFVMAYDMNDPGTPSPTAPLTGAGFSDLDAVQQYAAAVGPAKVILGVPYYGYDWPTAGPGLGDPATGPPTPLGYAQVTGNGGHDYWDPTTQTPWTSYQVGSQWHQTFFDDPTSLALKAQLANTYHLAGLGIWAMGMEGDSPAMLAALRGAGPVVKNLPPGPGVSALENPSTTTTQTPDYFYSGTWNGGPVTLDAVGLATIPAGSTTPTSGPLAGFATNDPAAQCLENGPALAVSSLTGTPGTYVVTADPPADCASGAWEFSTSSSTSTTVPSSTTTTSTPSTTDPGTPPSSTTSTTSAT